MASIQRVLKKFWRNTASAKDNHCGQFLNHHMFLGTDLGILNPNLENFSILMKKPKSITDIHLITTTNSELLTSPPLAYLMNCIADDLNTKHLPSVWY